MKTYDLLVEVAQIFRGERKAWEGDNIWKAKNYLHRFASDFKNAKETADDIEKNLSACSEISGLHPNRIQWIVKRIREVL